MGKQLSFCVLLMTLSISNAMAKPHGDDTFEIPSDTPKTTNLIRPARSVTPFTQWNSNNGYCGEVSFIQANMNQGQWMSQYNVRLLCGTGLSQSGQDGFCAANQGSSNYNAQFLIENPIAGDPRFASAGQCLKNARLDYGLYDYARAPKGIDGYKKYLSWVKAQTIAGRNVAIAVLNHGGSDSQYDHEVTVTQIGTNHAKNDANYYDDDVLYFDDHTNGGAPFTQGYTFQALGHTRAEANSAGAKTYSILIPGAYPVTSGTGGDGTHDNPRKLTASNFAFSVAGPLDPGHVTLPVTLTIVASNHGGSANPARSVVGLNYENPGLESSCTNKAPAWMGISLKATISDLTVGTAYNLYEYDFSSISGIGNQAALKVPDSRFNAQAGLASKATGFVATATTYTQTIQTTSDKVVVFRAVKASAP